MLDPLIMKVTVAMSAAFWEAGSPNLQTRFKREGLVHKTDAINEINVLLAYGTRVPETVIGAVACLANIAVSTLGIYPAVG